MTFEFDHQKSGSNKEKHGIDFNQAKNLWSDPGRVIIEARTTEERRYLMLAQWEGSLWSAVYTIRNGTTRIISVRKSRDNEKEIYKR